MSPQVMQVLTILCALSVASALATPCPRPCKCFADDSGIEAANCTDLPVRTTIAWPQRILRVQFAAAAGPVMLRNKAFSHFPRLTFLDVSGHAVQYVAASAFDGLPELVELNLAGTGVRKLDRHAFAGNRKLAFLSLRNNPGLIVTTSFLASGSITELDVSACGLSALKSVYFGGLPNLKYLFATNNRLTALGSQFAPPGIKYVNLADNRIGNIHDDLEAYKRLRTIDLTGNPVNCTCELSEVDRRLTARGVAFGNTVTCANTGVPLGDMVEACSDKEMLGDDPYKSDDLLVVDESMLLSRGERDEVGSGSGSGDGDGGLEFTTSEETTSEGTSSGETTSEGTSSGETTSEGTSSGETTSEGTSSGETTFGETTPGETTPGETTPGETTPEETTPGETTPGETTSESTGSQETTDETRTTEAAVPVDEAIFEKVSVKPDLAVNGGDGSSDSTTTTTTTTTAAVDHGIMSNPIQLPKDDDQKERSLTAAMDYLKSNVAVTGTAVILAVVIMAIVYKAVCAGKSRSRRAADAEGKTVELKEIKYMAADTEDSRKRDEEDRDELATPSSSAEENLLGDGDDDDTDDSDSDDAESSPSHTAAAATNGVVPNGKTNDAAAANVPTRVIVKLGETPKASKPITIDNVH